MDKILFCKVCPMKCYRGIENDKPGDSTVYVNDTGNAGEQFNFLPVENKIYGYIELGNDSQICIENIDGCGGFAGKMQTCNDITVIFVETRTYNVVGWYKNATVYRVPQERPGMTLDNNKPESKYNISADAEDCVLLPVNERPDWTLDDNLKKRFRSAMYTFAKNLGCQIYIKNLKEKIDNYK